jgi:phosphatidylserine decarboxylase
VSWRALRESRRYVGLAVLGDLALLAAGRRAGWLAGTTALVCLFFFRDPERPPSADEDAIYAPADGVITDVGPAAEEWLEDEKAMRVTTFLSVLDVHVTRSPVSGRIVLEEDLEGSLRPAFLRGAEENRRRRLAIDGPAGRVVLVQVAGSVARRITPWRRISDTVAAGERVGLIHFGSRADVLVPRERVEVIARRGERVRAGVTVLARYLREEQR